MSKALFCGKNCPGKNPYDPMMLAMNGWASMPSSPELSPKPKGTVGSTPVNNVPGCDVELRNISEPGILASQTDQLPAECRDPGRNRGILVVAERGLPQFTQSCHLGRRGEFLRRGVAPGGHI